MPRTKDKEQAILDLQKAAHKWVASEEERIDRETEFLKGVLKSSGAGSLLDSNFSKLSKKLDVSLSKLIGVEVE